MSMFSSLHSDFQDEEIEAYDQDKYVLASVSLLVGLVLKCTHTRIHLLQNLSTSK